MPIKKMMLGAAVIIGALVSTAFVRKRMIEEERAGLLAQAKFSAQQAEQKALAAFPGGRIIESEIEEEDGRIVYSFDLLVNGEKREVEIDAVTGAVLPADTDDEDDRDADDDDAKGKRRQARH